MVIEIRLVTGYLGGEARSVSRENMEVSGRLATSNFLISEPHMNVSAL